MSDFPEQASVVVIGGGIVGCSVAYHLAKLGIKDVVLLERQALGSGTSYHAAGMIREQQSSESATWMSKYTNQLFANLSKETGIDIHYRRVGSLYVTHDSDRMQEFKFSHTACDSFGVESQLLDAKGIQALWPLMNVTDLKGGFFMPQDAVVNPYQSTLAFAEGAKQYGAQLFENTKAVKILKKQGRVSGVETNQGVIACEHAVICGGVWSRDFATEIGANIPLHGCEHYYVLSEAIKGVELSLPAVRDFEARCYIRPAAGTYWDDEGQRLMCGFFEQGAKPWGMDGIPEDFAFAKLDEDWQHLAQVIENVKHRVPAMRDAKIEMLFNGPESFTHDNSYFVGEMPEQKGLYACTGFCSRGIQASGGAGYMVADLIKNGHSTLGVDFNDVDIRRCSAFTGNRKYLHDRVKEGLGLLFDMHYPYLQMTTSRPVRTTPFHDRLQAAGACFGEQSGWERANFYVNEGEEAVYKYSYGRQNWHENSAQEQRAVRENVGVFDQTSFAKFLVQGREALDFLNQICGAQMDVPIGRIVYTQALNERGGIEADWTVTRISEQAFWVITGVVSQARDFSLLNSISQDWYVSVTDITSAYAVLGIMGPNARSLLQKMTPADLNNDAFPFYTSQVIDFGYARVRANRLSYVGELGWELFIPTEFALSCYDQLVNECGSDFKLAGYHAMNALRLEKGYRHWGHDIADQDTPIEAGLSFAVDFGKAQFNGKDRLLAQKADGVHKRLVTFQLQSPEPLLHHLEPIYRNGTVVGYLTSGMFCSTLGTSIGMGYVKNSDDVLSKDYLLSANYEIGVLGQKQPATAHLSPLYDPKSLRMKV